MPIYFISAMALNNVINMLCMEIVSFLSVFSTDPLFSCIVTFYTLIFLYLPYLFRKIVSSPVIILTGILLLIILRLGAIQRSENEQKQNRGESEPVASEENREEKQGKPIERVETNSLEEIYHQITCDYEDEIKSEMGFESSLRFEESFVEWDVKAPLEVIYEEYEGEEAENDSNEKQKMGFSRYPSLSRYYPESDSDSSSESGFPATGNWESPENICFRWEDEEEEEEEDRELGLIEIALDGCKKRALEFQFEEENLIEIDISPTRYKEFSGAEELFSGEISCN
ncbi:hypothetical protein RIF29_41461 [Crotalaria pallida]|uniref:Transmembrane protein n=1 Tax=Crotalaria pallida TaxID=3830 RepID=A0AAN9EB93_CROPI